MSRYPYTNKNLLIDPENYMYSNYGGKQFLKDFFESRDESINNNLNFYDQERDNSKIPLAILFKIFKGYFTFPEKVLKKTQPSRAVKFKRDIELTDCLKDKNLIITEYLLIYIFSSIYKNNFNHDEQKWTEKIIQRFEVTKKIYDNYDYNFRKGSGNMNKLYLYWLLGVNLSLLYFQSGNLKYLNTLLKVNDLLCSVEKNKTQSDTSNIAIFFLLILEKEFLRSFQTK